MKKYYLFLAVLALISGWFINGVQTSAQTSAQSADVQVVHAPTASTTLVLSQVEGGNGTYIDDYVEIKNISDSSQSLTGLSLYYGSSTGNFGAGSFALPAVTVAPGQYFLVRLTQTGTTGAQLPVTPDATAAAGAVSMSGTNGKVGLVVAAQLATNACGATATPCSAAQLAAFVDWVAWGAAGNGPAGSGEGGTSVNNGVALTSVQGAVRKNGGCTDTDNNNLDFDVVTSPVPRNTATPLAPCSGGGTTNLSGFGSASPSSVAPGGLTLITVTVTPASTPPSTGIAVNADLSSIGGSATQQLFDDGTNGDATPGDNIFSYFAIVPVDAAGGIRSIPATITDAQARTAPANFTLTVSAPADPAEHIALGNPSNATTDANNPSNYLLVKSQYVISYNRDRGIPNWVAWHLDTTWLGSASRQNDFRPDPSLPAGWYQVTDTDYSGSGFDRGHHCPSGDRTSTVADNSATFFMTNMMPQAPYNNQGVWADLENYARSLATSGNELYIYAGGWGQGGSGTAGGVTNTIANGHVVVPALTWKVIVVLPVGSNDVDRITKNTRVISVIMPNNQTVGAPGTGNWRNYRVSVRKIEAMTGYSFFSNVRPIVRNILRVKLDNQ